MKTFLNNCVRSMQFRCLFFVVAAVLGLFTGFVAAESERPTVRLIYLIPNNREAQPDIDAKLDARIKKAQQLLADAMEQHGYGKKTFTFESDENGNAIVHHVNGVYDDAYYQNDPKSEIIEEMQQQFDLSKSIYFISVEISTDNFKYNNWTACGFGSDIGGEGGYAILPASGSCFENTPLSGIDLAAHELGHAFGLKHDFSDTNYIMSYGRGRTELSPCYAEWLNVHSFFNPDKVRMFNNNTRFFLLLSEYDVIPPHLFRLRFEIRDPDGLHQVQLVTLTAGTSIASGHAEFVDCKTLSGESKAIVEFETIEDLNEVRILVVDTNGNIVHKVYHIDYGSLIPDAEVATIPDPNLTAAIRAELDYAPGKQITTFDLTRLQDLRADNRDIKDLTGLEHAASLKFLYLARNQIHDLTPILKLSQLTTLSIGDNPFNDLKQLAKMTQLTRLYLGGSHISDISPLTRMTQLTHLYLGSSHISDISPLAGLTQLTQLGLNSNQISDIRPLNNITRLENLNLQRNQISDISPLQRLVRLKGLYLDYNNLIDNIAALKDMTQMRNLYLSKNPITDITPLTRMTQLVELYARECQISNIMPLADMTQLKALHLLNNQITDITPLSQSTQLVELYLSDCQISDITPLAGMTQLSALVLSNNQITNITSLTRLTKLKELGLSNNQISDARPLIGLTNLKRLWIWGNPITDRGPLLTLLRRNQGIKIYHKKVGKPLPVTLSSFKAVRTADGAVINWTTASELNNAGFNIFRSDTRNGAFRQVNAKLIKGAGTTGERSTYTWTDTTAKPNTVYYYQIEDVSYAGVHQTLATTRVRGLISAKGKMVTRWAHFKSLQ